MRSIFCKAKTATKHGLNVVRVKNCKGRYVQSFAKRQKLKKDEFRAVRAKIWKKKCVQPFAKRKQTKNLDLALLELKTGKIYRFVQSFGKRK